MNAYTERQWSEKYHDYEGDGGIEEALVLVEWDDPNETPSQAISRLNTEVVETSREITARWYWRGVKDATVFCENCGVSRAYHFTINNDGSKTDTQRFLNKCNGWKNTRTEDNN